MSESQIQNSQFTVLVVDDDDVAVAASSFSLLPSPMTFDSNSLVIAVLLVNLLSVNVFTAFGDNFVFVE